jgi:hypothetical protein
MYLVSKLTKMKDAENMITMDFRRTFNKEWLIRYYPDSKVRGVHSLIGIHTFADIIGDAETFVNIIRRIEDTPDQSITVKLRRGIEFRFARH